MSQHSSSGTLSPTLPLPSALANDYAGLKLRIKKLGLLEKQPVYYTYKIFLTMGLLVVGLLFLVFGPHSWIQLLNAAYLAIVFAQIGFIGHDIGHRQIFASGWKNDLAGLVCADLLVGMSLGWWIDKHNRHHSHPNQIDLDPDLNLPGISFTLEEARTRRNFGRFIMLHQIFLFFPMLLFVALDLQRASVSYLLHEKGKYRLLESVLLLLHFVVPTCVLLALLGFWPTIAFIALHQALLGFILGSAFAPNHKGMPVLAKECDMDFLRRQVLTARNIRASRFTDFWYGGLNYQIEHHLFPSMPRNNLRAAQRVVKAFCQEYDISYAETGILGSYQAVLHQLHEVSTSARQAE